jgi:hypothetical protein
VSKSQTTLRARVAQVLQASQQMEQLQHALLMTITVRIIQFD